MLKPIPASTHTVYWVHQWPALWTSTSYNLLSGLWRVIYVQIKCWTSVCEGWQLVGSWTDSSVNLSHKMNEWLTNPLCNFPGLNKERGNKIHKHIHTEISPMLSLHPQTLHYKGKFDSVPDSKPEVFLRPCDVYRLLSTTSWTRKATATNSKRRRANDRPNYLFWSKFNPDKPVWCNTGPESGQCWNVWGIIHLSLSLVHTQHNDLDNFFWQNSTFVLFCLPWSR